MTEGLASTPLALWIVAWLAHQRSLGRDYGAAEWILKHMQRFVVTRMHAPDLDQASFDLWCDSFRHLAATTRRGRQLIVRKFCLYRQRAEPHCFVPNPLYFVRLSPYRRPVIIEPQQVAQMLVAADNLAPSAGSPLLPVVMRLAVVLLYTAGLRRGELVRLSLDDVDPQAELLRIRASKFHKSRLVPLSPDAASELRAYLRYRLAPPFDTNPSAPLLCNGAGVHRRYTGRGLGQAVNRLFVAANVVDEEGRRPRVHDLRHSFAVEALIRWYRAGADVQSNLPRLSMYMGHVSIVSTAHYLHFVPTMRELASERFEAAFGDVVEEVRHESV
jgi:integrase/recombinase XerD